jgi:hypothetical protein
MAYFPRVAAIIGLGLALSASASAAVVLQTGFEQPAYTPGSLSGQNGWSGGIGIVGNEFPFAGAQEVTVNSAGQTGQLLSSLATPFGLGSHDVRVSIEFLVLPDDAATFWNPLALFGNSGFIGQIQVNGDRAIFGTNGGPQTVFAIDTYNLYTLDVNFDTDTITALLNDVAFGSSAFDASNTGLARTAFGINVADGTGISTALFDNLEIDVTADATVPEPSMLAVFAIGLLGAGVARRRKDRKGREGRVTR